MQKTSQTLSAALLAGLIAACGSGRDWKMPEFPSDLAELTRFHEKEQAQLLRSLPEPERFPSDQASPDKAALWAAPDRRELSERLGRTESIQTELIAGLAGTSGLGDRGPGAIGRDLAGALERQSEDLGVLRQRLEAALADSGLGEGGAGDSPSIPATDLRELEASMERRLMRFSDSDTEQLARLARVEQRTEKLGQSLKPAVETSRKWLFGLAALGLLPLVALWLRRGNKSELEAHQRELERLNQDLGRLDENHKRVGEVRPLEAGVATAGQRSEAVSAAGAAALALAAAARAKGPNRGQAAGTPGTEDDPNLPNFELPRQKPSFEQRRSDQDPLHTPARSLAPFTGQSPGEFELDPSSGSADLSRATTSRDALMALSADPEASATETYSHRREEPITDREHFELTLVRHLEQRQAARRLGEPDSFEEFAARSRAAESSGPSQSVSLDRELAWTRRNAAEAGTTPVSEQGQPRVAPESQRSQGEAEAQPMDFGALPSPLEAQDALAEERGLLERLAKLRPNQDSGIWKAAQAEAQPESEQADDMRTRVIDPPWSALSPLPAGEQNQARFETELEKAFRALEQERQAHENELRQAIEALDEGRHPSAEFLPSEDEDRPE